MPKRSVSFVVNGKPASVETYPMKRLLDVLREDLGLHGTKEGCGEGECGACAVIVDGELVNSCLIPAATAEGTHVSTIEGVAGRAIQDAFVESGGAQCGICTPGMIMAAIHLLSREPHATTDQIREGLAGNLCRCTGYTKIIAAVEKAAQSMA
jgi:aerobic carbon-monoxide dehydrogenase small subunit